jgi:hypothetical protein
LTVLGYRPLWLPPEIKIQCIIDKNEADALIEREISWELVGAEVALGETFWLDAGNDLF